MDGPLLAAAGIFDATDYFLPSHILMLLVIGIFCPAAFFKRLFPAGCILTGLLTMALGVVDSFYDLYILVLLGISGAFVAIGTGISLRQSDRPLLSAAIGLVAANIAMFLFTGYADGGLWSFAAAAVPLLVIPELLRRLPETETRREAKNLWHYLLFIMLFKVICGLMYSFIQPLYQEAAMLSGLELLFYMAAVGASYYVVQINRDLAVAMGVILGMIAFTFFQAGFPPLSVNVGMFATQAGAGAVDLVLLAVLISLPGPVRAFGIGLAMVCTGIIAGKTVGLYLAHMAESIMLAGHLVLNASILVLYFLGRYHYRFALPAPISLPGEAVKPIELEPAGDSCTSGAADLKTPATALPDEAAGAKEPPTIINKDQIEDGMPDYLRLLLSEREYFVLKRALLGSTYRQIARELDISESTVKTYMRRIYEKTGAKGKKQLVETLNRL
ncbi:MAG: LuxR C-terminal-related transcriptional regulator [Desulfosalsimonas sp.]